MRIFSRLAIICCLTIGLSSGLIAGDDAHAALEGKNIIPTKMCMMCHRKADMGDQAGKWKAGPHAKAFDSLKTDEAKAVAAKLGVSDPTTSGKCLRCHSTAYGFTEERVSTKISPQDGVDCQSCHGAGKTYVMKHKKDPAKAYAEMGLVKPNEANTCSRCHNKDNPTYNPERYKKADGTTTDFDFEQAYQKIKHEKK